MTIVRRQALVVVSGIFVLAACHPAAARAQAPALGVAPFMVGALRNVRFDVSPPDLPQTATNAPVVTAPTRSPRPAWNLEFHGGTVSSSNPTGGAGTLPPSGMSFPTSSGIVSPAVSSWYFGDGAAWLNRTLTVVAPSFKVAAIDTVLTSAATGRGRGGAIGFRMARAASDRIEVEFTFDASSGSCALTSSALTALQKSSDTFSAAWNGILGGFPAASSTSHLTGTVSGGDQAFGTGTVNIYFRRRRFSPYVTGGAGLAVNRGSVSAALAGNLQFFVSTFSKTETDLVTVTFTEAHIEPVVALGGGFTGDVTGRSGVRADVRVYLSGNSARTVVSASPSTTGTPTVEDLVSPGGGVIQFSGVLGTASTLSVPVTNVQTFAGGGLRAQVALLVGYFIRF
jgi:hypothetical protein